MDLPDPLQLPGSGLSAPHGGVLTHHRSALAGCGRTCLSQRLKQEDVNSEAEIELWQGMAGPH